MTLRNGSSPPLERPVIAPTAIGFDIGGTNARCIRFDADRIPHVAESRSSNDPTALVATLVTLAETLAAVDPSAPEVVGVGIAGLVEQNRVMRYSPNMPGLVDFDIGGILSDEFGVPVFVENDANAAAWAERTFGVAQGEEHVVLVTLGTGVGTGIIVGGGLLRGAHGFAGESGHMIVDQHGPEHITGARGPWELFASGDALGRLAQTRAAAGSEMALTEFAGGVDHISGGLIERFVQTSPEDAGPLLDAFADEVAVGLVGLAVVLDPELFVLGGGVATLGEPLRRAVQRAFDTRLVGSAHRPSVEVRLAQLGPQAGAIGAAQLAIESLRSS